MEAGMNPFWLGVFVGAIGALAIAGLGVWFVGAVNVWFLEQDK